MTYPAGLFEFAMLATMKPAERRRATTPLVMTMLPGPPAQRSAMAAMAVTTQTREGLQRERRGANATVAAVVLAAQDPEAFTPETLRAIPALSALDVDALHATIVAALAEFADGAGDVVAQARGILAEAPRVAELLIAGRAVPKLTDDQAAEIPAFLAALPDDHPLKA